jgi:hypothetical protein
MVPVKRCLALTTLVAMLAVLGFFKRTTGTVGVGSLIVLGVLLVVLVGVVLHSPRCLVRRLQARYPEVVFMRRTTPAINTVALTIDDVPCSDATCEALLTCLRRHQVQATFFVIVCIGPIKRGLSWCALFSTATSSPTMDGRTFAHSTSRCLRYH